MSFFVNQVTHLPAAEIALIGNDRFVQDFETNLVYTLIAFFQDDTKIDNGELDRWLQNSKAKGKTAENLLFLQEVCTKLLLNEKVPQELLFDQEPTYLPIPFSLSLLPNVAATVTFSSVALALLLTPFFQPKHPFTCQYEAFVQRVLAGILESNETKHSITICQKNVEYSCQLTLAQIVLLFLPAQFEKVQDFLAWQTTLKVSNAITSSYPFHFRDRRLQERKETQNSLVESLIVSNTLGDVLYRVPHSAAIVASVVWQISKILQEGVLAIEAVPRVSFLRSIVGITGNLLQKIDDKVLFRETLAETTEFLQRKKVGLEIDGEVAHNFHDYEERKKKLATLYHTSFLVKDLLVKAGLRWQGSHLQKYEIEPLFGRIHLQAMQSAPQGLHLVVSDQMYHMGDMALEKVYIDAMLDAWHQAALFMDPNELAQEYIALCIKAVTQKLRYDNPVPAKHFAVACLSLFTVMDADIMYSDDRFVRIMQSGIETYAAQHIHDLTVWMHEQSRYEQVRSKILKAISIVRKWAKTELFLEVIGNLEQILERRGSLEEIRQALVYFTTAIPRIESIHPREALFAEMLFRAHLAAIRLRDRALFYPPFHKMQQFSTEQYHIVRQKEQLVIFCKDYKSEPNIHTLCFTSSDVVQNPELIRKIVPLVTTCVYISSERPAPAFAAAFAAKTFIYLKIDSQLKCAATDLPPEFFPS